MDFWFFLLLVTFYSHQLKAKNENYILFLRLLFRQLVLELSTNEGMYV